jgi:hypothetical protein
LSEKQLLLIEEISPYTSPVDDPRRSFVAGNPRSGAHVVPCYGHPTYSTYNKRPVLCSGTIIGNRFMTLSFLEDFVSEFHSNNKKQNVKCKSPYTTDQWTMNWMYYNGKFRHSDRIVTLPWGVGPVLTAGKACITADKKTGAHDLIIQNAEGFLMNAHDGNVPSVVHQFDRCGDWIHRDIFLRHSQIYKTFLIT